MSSYNENIARLKQASSSNTNLANQYETNAAQAEGQWHIDHARQVAAGLEQFSGTLKEWRKKDIEKKLEKGKQEARREKTENAQRLIEISEELKIVKAEDTRFHELKAEQLKLAGPDGYPEADRLAKLSRWGQVGYAREKIRVFNESFDDQLTHWMQNSEQAITVQGITFTPKEMRDHNINGLPFKEAAIEVGSEFLREQAGMNRYTEEMHKLAGTSDSMTKAKEGLLEKYRERYNIDASMQTRAQASLDWSHSARTGDDLYRLLLKNSATVNESNQILGNAGGWDQVMGHLAQEGIALSDPTYADKMGNLEIPPALAQKLGVKPGTTYAQQWPQRFTALKSSIKKGYVEATNAELAYQKADGVKLQAEFIEEARKRPLSETEVNEWKRKFGQAGLPIPGSVTNYETLSDRDEREDKETIEALMASNGGYITNEQLDRFHPKAALEFRDKAAKLEKASLEAHDAQKKIKAHLDTAFANMGIKGNEKSPAYVEAMSNAKADYQQKYSNYISMGYSSAEASHLALHATEVQDQDGKPIPDSMGVLTEIKQNGEGSKYVITGQSIEKELPAGDLRVARISSGKRELREDPNIMFTGTIGGDYGRRQLDSIIDNIAKHGTNKGVLQDKAARKYYEGLARGRDGNWMGIVDAQLKARGHEGLWPKERPPVHDLFEGKTMTGEVVEDPTGVLPMAKHMERAGKYPSAQTYVYTHGIASGCTGFPSPYDYWERPEMRLPWIGTPPINMPQRDPWRSPTWPGTPPFNPNAVSVKTGGY